MTTITVVCKGGEKRKVELVNADSLSTLLSNFQAVSLKNDDGVELFSFESIVHGESYAFGYLPQQPQPATAIYPPGTPPNQSIGFVKDLPQLPDSPPRNGVKRAGFVLAREKLVLRITTTANPIVIIHSAPATGKTSLLDLTQYALEKRKGTKVVRFPIASGDGILQRLERLVGVRVPDDLESLPVDTWILIDDAQLAFEAKDFWKVIIKDVESSGSKRIHVVIAATYDLASAGTTPYMFAEYPHLSDLKLTREESEALYDGYLNNIEWASGWIGFKDTLLKLAGGHVGVLSGGISMLHRIYSNEGKQLSESEALDALRDHRFRVNLGRCFPCQKLMDDAQRKVVGQTIMGGSTTDCINASQGSMDNPALVQLARAGVLSATGAFSCLVAQWQYFNVFYSRPTEGPASLEDLIRRAVSTMSALRLRQSRDKFSFPKEAAFQHLFNEALTMQLPPNVAVCPEVNTFAKDPTGKAVTGELDFFVFGNLDWAVELLRNGDKINEHVKRFDPTVGKYRLVGHTAHLVVDCRGPCTKAVQSMQERCTLYFADNFETVQCKMRHQPIETISLRD